MDYWNERSKFSRSGGSGHLVIGCYWKYRTKFSGFTGSGGRGHLHTVVSGNISQGSVEASVNKGKVIFTVIGS